MNNSILPNDVVKRIADNIYLSAKLYTEAMIAFATTRSTKDPLYISPLLSQVTSDDSVEGKLHNLILEQTIRVANTLDPYQVSTTPNTVKRGKKNITVSTAEQVVSANFISDVEAVAHRCALSSLQYLEPEAFAYAKTVLTPPEKSAK